METLKEEFLRVTKDDSIELNFGVACYDQTGYFEVIDKYAEVRRFANAEDAAKYYFDNDYSIPHANGMEVYPSDYGQPEIESFSSPIWQYMNGFKRFSSNFEVNKVTLESFCAIGEEVSIITSEVNCHTSPSILAVELKKDFILNESKVDKMKQYIKDTWGIECLRAEECIHELKILKFKINAALRNKCTPVIHWHL